MKKGLKVLGLTFLVLLLCCPARAQTWRELLNEADSLSNIADYDSAIMLGSMALEKAKIQFGESDTSVALVLDQMGAYHYHRADYDEAEFLWKRALAIREEAFGSEHPLVAKTIHNLASLYDDQGKYAESEPLHLRALAIREKVLGPDHLDVAASLINLGNLYYDKGKYTEAIRLHKRALAIFEKSLGPDHPNVACSLHNLADLYFEQAKYAEAEPLYRRALAISEKGFGPEHPYVGMSLNNLANLYYEQGKYSEAELLHKRALAIFEDALGSDHPYVGYCLNGLGDLYHRQERYAEAETLFRQALTVSERTLGPDHPETAYSLNKLADVYRDQGRYTEAEPLVQRSLEIFENAVGPDHPDVAMGLNNLANLYRDQGKYPKAEPFYNQALERLERALGTEHPKVALCLESFSYYYRIQGGGKKSFDMAKCAFEIRKSNFRDGASVMSEKDALTYSQFMRNSASNLLSAYFKLGLEQEGFDFATVDVIFSSKGQVSDGIFARHRTKVYEKNPSLEALSDSLRYARFKLANLYVQGPGEQDPEGYKEELQEVSKEKERLEAELARQSADFRRELELWEINAGKVAGALPPRSTLVEYLKYDRLTTGRETEPHYLLVVVDNRVNISISDIGSSNEIDSLVALYRSHFQEVSKRGGSPFFKDLADYKEITAKLYERIWKPVENKLGDANLVFIAPDGALNLVSFAGLTAGEDKYLIETYPIHYLSSGRDLIRLKQVVESGEGLFALGDPNFDAPPLDRLYSMSARISTEESDTSINALRNTRSGCEELNEITVLPLPGTRKEIERISDAWKKESKEPCYVFFGTDASEENFKRNAPGNKVIHLATHGYYAQSQCSRELPQKKFRMSEAFVGENPLLLSGLFLAGANLHGEGADSLGVEDGILTAEEVTCLDLEGTRWVVLSACESGLGEVKSGEGVYGLRRAFQMAGARTVISALWPVSDKTTAEMMSYLYGFKENNLALAMQSLARNKLAELRKRNQPDHPYLWAPFIALGDWR